MIRVLLLIRFGKVHFHVWAKCILVNSLSTLVLFGEQKYGLGSLFRPRTIAYFKICLKSRH